MFYLKGIRGRISGRGSRSLIEASISSEPLELRGTTDHCSESNRPAQGEGHRSPVDMGPGELGLTGMSFVPTQLFGLSSSVAETSVTQPNTHPLLPPQPQIPT